MRYYVCGDIRIPHISQIHYGLHFMVGNYNGECPIYIPYSRVICEMPEVKPVFLFICLLISWIFVTILIYRSINFAWIYFTIAYWRENFTLSVIKTRSLWIVFVLRYATMYDSYAFSARHYLITVLNKYVAVIAGVVWSFARFAELFDILW